MIAEVGFFVVSDPDAEVQRLNLLSMGAPVALQCMKKSLIVGVINERNVAHDCAEIFHRVDASLAVSHLTANAESYRRMLGEWLASPIIVSFDACKEPT